MGQPSAVKEILLEIKEDIQVEYLILPTEEISDKQVQETSNHKLPLSIQQWINLD
jgi:hypothetical protein